LSQPIPYVGRQSFQYLSQDPASTLLPPFITSSVLNSIINKLLNTIEKNKTIENCIHHLLIIIHGLFLL
jgi:hypothetical protein